MNHIDTHDVEVAFDELIKELSKLKDLNNLVDAYKDNIDTLSTKIERVADQIQSFYNSAREHESSVNLLYKGYVYKAEQISVELGKYSLEFKKIARRNMIFNIITLVITLLSFVGLMFLIFA